MLVMKFEFYALVVNSDGKITISEQRRIVTTFSHGSTGNSHVSMLMYINAITTLFMP